MAVHWAAQEWDAVRCACGGSTDRCCSMKKQVQKNEGTIVCVCVLWVCARFMGNVFGVGVLYLFAASSVVGVFDGF